MKVGIAGVGGIGSNVAVQLVRAGCSFLKIVDFDRVERSNLNRQFYFADQIGGHKVDMLRENLLRIAPGLHIEALCLRLTPDNLAATFVDCQVIVEGFDEETSKKQLLEAFADHQGHIVSASGIAGRELAHIRVQKFGNCTIVGDFSTDYRHGSLYAPKISLIAAIMADRVLATGEKDGKGN